MAHAISVDDVRAAAGRIAGAVEHTPSVHSRTLSRLTGAQVFLKFENLQFTASFKERGALNKLLSLSAEERRRGVIAMSAGNHAQAVAYHAARLGMPAVIVMPKGSPNTKIKNTQVHGAEVVLEGDSLAEAGAPCRRARAGATTWSSCTPTRTALVIAGQGTIGLEMLAAVPDLDIAGGADRRRRPDLRHRHRREGAQSEGSGIFGVESKNLSLHAPAPEGPAGRGRRRHHRRGHRGQGRRRHRLRHRPRAGRGSAGGEGGDHRARGGGADRDREDRRRRRGRRRRSPRCSSIRSASPASASACRSPAATSTAACSPRC